MTGSRRRRQQDGASRNRAAPFRCRLVIMVKAPVAGAVKTRLARQIGVAGATRFARHAAAALIARVAFDRRWHTTLCVAPDASVHAHHWPRTLARVAQGRGDLGRRMQHILERARPGPVVIIGTDIPGIAPAHIARAFRALGGCACVVGPATDGGYWLFGARRRPCTPRPFERVRWSSEHALADTLGSLAGCSVGLVATLSDVDDADAYARAAARFGRRVPPPVIPG